MNAPTVQKAHLIVQLDNGKNNESTLLIFKGWVNALGTNKTAAVDKCMEIHAQIAVEDYIQLDSLGIESIDEVVARALKDVGFRAVETSEQELGEMLERQIEF